MYRIANSNDKLYSKSQLLVKIDTTRDLHSEVDHLIHGVHYKS